MATFSEYTQQYMRDKKKKETSAAGKSFSEYTREVLDIDSEDTAYRAPAQSETKISDREQLQSNLNQKQQQNKNFLDSDENVGFWDAMLPGGATPTQYKESRQKKKQYEKETQEAAAQVAAYEQYWQQQKVAGKSSAEIDSYLKEGDEKIARLESEKGSFWESMKPGGVKPSEWKENRDAKEAEIKKIESQQGMYRAVRDEKKSREMTDGLPADVKRLLDEYNGYTDLNDRTDLYNLFTPADRKSHTQINSAKLQNAAKQQEVADKLVGMGYENYKELAEYRKYITDIEKTKRIEGEAETLAKENRAVASAVSILTAPSATVYATKNFDPQRETDLRANPYSEYNVLNAASEKMQGTVAESFEDGVISADTKKLLYNTAMSGADSAMMGLFGSPALTGGYFFLKSFNSGYNETLKKGGTMEQAVLTGVIDGAAEGVCEAVSLGMFVKGTDAKTVKAFIKNMLVQAGVNAQEEATTELVNILTDYYVNGGISDYYKNYEYALSTGMSEEEAKAYAKKISAEQIGEAALSGTLMGTVFGVAGSGAGVAGYNAQLKDIGKQMVAEGKVDEVLAGAADVQDNDKLMQLAEEIEANEQAKASAESKKYKGKEYRSIGKLVEGLDEATVQDRSKIIETAVKERLTALGETDNVAVKAAAITKAVENRGRTADKVERLTKAEKTALKDGKYTQRVMNELTDSLGEYYSEWAEGVSESVADLYERRYEPDVEAYKAGKRTDEPSPSLRDTSPEGRGKEATAPEGDKVDLPEGDNAEKVKEQFKAALIQEDQDAEIFDAGFEQYYEQGRSGGYEFTEIKNNPNVSESFTEYQRQQAFELGVHQGLKDTASVKYKGDTVAVFVNGYSGKSTVNSYAQAFDRFYAEGAHTKKSFDDVLKSEGHLFKIIDEGVAKKAFEEGKAERSRADKATKQKKQTGKLPSKGEYRNKSITLGEEAVDEFYTALAKKTGIDIDRVQSLRTLSGKTANAQYVASTNKLTASATATNELQAAVHELVHFAFAYNTDKMKPVKQAVMDYLLSKKSAMYLEDALDRYRESYEGESRAYIEEEFVADAVGGMFSTEDGVQDFINWLQEESGYKAEEKKTILQRITEWLGDIIEAIKDIMNDGELNGVGKLFAKQQSDELAKIRKLFLEALDSAGANYREGGAVEEGVKNSIQDKKITPDMSEKDRTEVLKNTELNIVKYEGNDELNGASVMKLKTSYNSEASKILKILGEKFGVFKGYTNNNIELEFVYSKGSLNESIHKQGDVSTNFYDFARMLYVFDDVVRNAVPVEVHTDKYKGTKREDSRLKYDYVLISAFSTEHHIIPIELHIKEYSESKGQKNKLYVSITLGKIKIENNVKVQRSDESEGNTQLSSIISLPQLISKIKPEYGNFYKYIPKSLLNDNQIKSKEIAEADEEYRLMIMRGEDVSQVLKDKAIEKGYDTDFSYRMDHRAPNAKYDVCITDIDRAYGGDGSIYSQYAAHYYGDGRSYDYKAINVIKRARSSPNMLITIYRAVPTNVKDTRIRNGDWVTIVKDYAEEHGWRTLDDDYRIIENKVPAKYLFTDGNSIHEFGYDNGNTNEVYKNTGNNVKVTEVTYDERGQIIPLSKRFDESKADVKYSLDLSHLDWVDFSNDELEARNRSLAKKNTELDKINDELRAQIRHPGVKHIVSQLGVQKAARHLKGEYMSKINIHKLSGELGDFYTLIANGDGISWDSLQIHLERIADMILNESKYKKPDISDYAKDVLRDIRSVKIKLNDEQKSEVASEYGSYNEFRKRTMGTLVLSNEGISLDERWGELSEAYPHFFPEDTADTDQPRVLMEAVASLRETYEDMNGMDLASAKDMLMTEIYEQYFEVPETKYISEEYALKLARAKVDYGEKLREAKADFKKQWDEAYKKAQDEFDKTLRETLKGIRAEEAEAILQAKARYNLRAERMADTRVREKKRANIIKQVKRLDRLLRTPGKGAPSAGTNKYEQKYVHLTNIPESLKRTVIDFCSVFIEHDAGVFSGYKKNDSVSVREKKIEALQKQYKLLKQTDVYLKESVVEGMAEKLDKVAEIMAERRLSQLTASELDTVIEITDHLITVINNQVEMWVDGKKHKVEGLGSAAVDQLKEKGQYKHLPLPGHDFVKGWGVNNMKPVYFFERVGGVLEKLFLEMQNKGQRDYARNINAAAAFMDEASKRFDYKKWSDAEPLTLKTTQGDTLKLTKAQAMHIWATAKREAITSKDSMHLMQGGIVFEDEIEADFEVDNKKDKSKKKKLSSEVWRYKKSDGSAHRISLDDLDKISEYLTDEQKKFVDTMVGYLSNDMAALGNEVSMELYGIRRFNEKYYIPFNSAKNFIYRSMGEQGEAMLRSESFTKETTFGANNPLVVGDFLDVVAGHIERMAMYNSMVLPLENFSKIWNFKTFVPEGDEITSQVSVRSAMETAFGKSYVSYVDTLLKDINGGINADSREKSIGRLLSNFKKTAVLGSVSVVIQQPSAIVRAFAEIDPSYFVASTFAKRKTAWEKALKYSSTALLKDIGGFDTVSGRGSVDWLTKTEYEGKDKVLAFFKDSQYRDDIIAWGPGFADKVTWAHIWAACEREVASKNKGLQGEELYKKTGERFDEVINKTQVYDSVLTKSAHMRSKSQAMQVVTSFMSEPTTQANMIASAMFNAKKGDKKKAARIYSSVILSQLFNAALVSAIYAARDDDEDKTLVEKYLAELASNFVGSLNPLTMIPLFKDVWSLLEGYDVERSDMAVYADVVDSWKAWKSDSKTLAEKLTGTIGSIGNAFGLPLKNILRDAAAMVNVAKSVGNISDTTGKGIFYALEESLFPVTENLTKWKPTTKEEKLYAAFSEGDKKMYNRIASQYTSGGKIKSDLKKQIGERFVEGDIDERTAISQFRKLGLTENEAYYEVRSLKEPLPEEESEDTNADFFDFDSMQSIQGDADAELEADRQKAEEEGEEYSEKGDYDWLDEALSSGDRASISKEVNDLKSRGVTESKINGHVKTWIKENDSSVAREANKYQSGDLSSFESTVKSVAGRYGVDESAVAGAIRSAAGDNSKAIEGTIYAYGDLHRAMKSNDSFRSKKIVNEIVGAKTEQYIAEGDSQKEAKERAEEAVRSSLRSYWKEEYLKSDTSGRGDIRVRLKDTGLWTYSKVLEMTRKWDKEK